MCTHTTHTHTHTQTNTHTYTFMLCMHSTHSEIAHPLFSIINWWDHQCNHTLHTPDYIKSYRARVSTTINWWDHPCNHTLHTPDYIKSYRARVSTTINWWDHQPTNYSISLTHMAVRLPPPLLRPLQCLQLVRSPMHGQCKWARSWWVTRSEARLR